MTVFSRLTSFLLHGALFAATVLPAGRALASGEPIDSDHAVAANVMTPTSIIPVPVAEIELFDAEVGGAITIPIYATQGTMGHDAKVVGYLHQPVPFVQPTADGELFSEVISPSLDNSETAMIATLNLRLSSRDWREATELAVAIASPKHSRRKAMLAPTQEVFVRLSVPGTNVFVEASQSTPQPSDVVPVKLAFRSIASFRQVQNAYRAGTLKLECFSRIGRKTRETATVTLTLTADKINELNSRLASRLGANRKVLFKDDFVDLLSKKEIVEAGGMDATSENVARLALSVPLPDLFGFARHSSVMSISELSQADRNKLADYLSPILTRSGDSQVESAQSGSSREREISSSVALDGKFSVAKVGTVGGSATQNRRMLESSFKNHGVQIAMSQDGEHFTIESIRVYHAFRARDKDEIKSTRTFNVSVYPRNSYADFGSQTVEPLDATNRFNGPQSELLAKYVAAAEPRLASLKSFHQQLLDVNDEIDTFEGLLRKYSNSVAELPEADRRKVVSTLKTRLEQTKAKQASATDEYTNLQADPIVQ